MRMLIALRDEKTGRFLSPVSVLTPGEAQRWYEEVVTTPGTMVAKFPNDFSLYTIGSYDDLTGEVDCNRSDAGEAQLPRLLLTAAQFVKPDARQLELLKEAKA